MNESLGLPNISLHHALLTFRAILSGDHECIKGFNFYWLFLIIGFPVSLIGGTFCCVRMGCCKNAGGGGGSSSSHSWGRSWSFGDGGGWGGGDSGGGGGGDF